MSWDPAKTDPSLTISQDGKSLRKTSGSAHAIALWDTPAGTGPSYIQLAIGRLGDIGVGLATGSRSIDSSDIGADQQTSAGLYNNGWFLNTGGAWQRAVGFAQGDTVGVLYDPATKAATWDVNGTIILTETLQFPAGVDVFPAVILTAVNDAVTGQGNPTNIPEGSAAWGPAAVPDLSLPQTFHAVQGATIPAEKDGGPRVLELQGLVEAGDCIPLSATRTSTDDSGYAGIFTKTDAGGQKWVILPDANGVEFEWTGCPVDTGPDDPADGPPSSPYFAAYLAYARRNADLLGDVGRLNVRKAYFIDQPWVVADSTVTIHMHGTSKRGYQLKPSVVISHPASVA